MGGNRNTYSSIVLPNSLIEEISSIQENIITIYPNFKAQPMNGLHMTFIYLGDKLSYQQTNSLIQLHSKIICKEKWNFTFEKFELFPPGKQNLIIAKFKTTKTLIEERNNLINQIGVNNLKDEDPYEWIPHITLGKLVGKQNRVELNFNRLNSFNADHIKVINPYFI